ncbi:MAG: hypothetical protein ACREET_08275, partial [Stellaceae bacterium]
MSDNPFSEPDDSDRTIIRPAPGGRRPAAPVPQPLAPPQFEPAPPRAGVPAAADDGAEGVASAISPLVAAAATFLYLISRLR